MRCSLKLRPVFWPREASRRGGGVGVDREAVFCHIFETRIVDAQERIRRLFRGERNSSVGSLFCAKRGFSRAGFQPFVLLSASARRRVLFRVIVAAINLGVIGHLAQLNKGLPPSLPPCLQTVVHSPEKKACRHRKGPSLPESKRKTSAGMPWRFDDFAAQVREGDKIACFDAARKASICSASLEGR